MNKKIGAFDNFYASILYRILKQQGAIHQRTGLLIKALPGVLYTSENLPLLSLRDINIKWSCIELVWSIAGRSDIKFFNDLGFHAWDAFANKEGYVESSYGHRWRNTFQRDQLMDIVKGMKMNPTTRQGFMTTWDQRSDGLCQPRKPNVPCVAAWHFHIIEGRLNLTVMQRSADMIVGYPHDILQGFILMVLFASHLKVSTGSLTYLASNAHIYQDHFEQAEEMVERKLPGAKKQRLIQKPSDPNVQAAQEALERD